MFLCATTSAIPQDACNYQQRVCECDPGEPECRFSLVIEDLLSLASYKLDRSASGQIRRRNNALSTNYNISSQGQLVPATGNQKNDPSSCILYNETFLENNCSIPMTVDSIGGGAIIAVNGLFPGPTLVVTEEQTVIVEVTNALINKEVSIHWHGQLQNNTPWMDGVDHISQCPIPTYARFRYIFKASPSGTMWYHSHVGTQRTEGLFGALIVREKDTVFNNAQSRLQNLTTSNFTIVNNPNHTMTILDFQNVDAVEITIRTINRNPSNVPRLGPDGTIISRVNFYVGLINGFGKAMNISYNRSRLSIFNVLPYNQSNPVYYRFRMVGSQRHDLFRVSISEHRLIVISTDGFLTKPIEVDYIFVHAGERYDFLLKPKTEEETREQANYLISGDTLDSSDNVTRRAEAILHYGDESGNPTSTEYESIINDHIPRTCNSTSRCQALNCPFKFYAPNFSIDCIPVTELQLLFPTPSNDVPSNNIDHSKNEHFFDFAFTGSDQSAAISGRNLAFPAGSLLTNIDAAFNLDCKPGFINCSADRSQCICQNILNISDTYATIQFVLTNIGDSQIGNKAAHPIHIHGHSFQVVGIYYGAYNDSTGILVSNNDNVTCNITDTMITDSSCTNPHWAGSPVDGTINDTTIRKDTIIVPPGGYVVLRFISNNWGFWYMHCHIEPHFLEGMAMVINEGYELQNVPPDNLVALQCGDFNWTVNEFNSRLNMPLERRSVSCTSPLCSRPSPNRRCTHNINFPYKAL